MAPPAPLLWAYRQASRLKRATLGRRVVSVRSGPAEGLKVGLHLASADYSSGDNERPVQDALATHLEPGHTLYDVGSNVGFFALLGARLVGPTGAVHAFEAVPECARALERNRKRNRFEQISVHQVAVGRRSGPVQVYQGRHPGGATISARDQPSELVSTITVPAVTIDELVSAGDLPLPDLVKIDVEGAEADVLAGMTETMDRARPVILYELDDSDADGLEAKRHEVSQFLDPLGYHQHQLDPSYPSSRSLVVHVLALPPS